MSYNRYKNKFFCFVYVFCFLLSILSVKVFAIEKAYIGGMPFGIRFDSGEVSVIKTTSFKSNGEKVSPAADAGIIANDVIISVNDKNISSIYDVISEIKASDKRSIKLSLKRNKKIICAEFEPKTDDETGEKQLGLLLKDSSAGIGTVTLIKEDMHTFAGLGHGICDNDNGEILNIDTGYISEVKICGISKGKSGIPGELRGIISAEKSGKLLNNSEVGIWGVYTNIVSENDTMIETAKKDEVKVGKAKIYCTLDDNQRNEYDIEIKEINVADNVKTKNFIIKVTDKTLLEKTGGIVQGMSGSPIVQNGKLVGAVTHVMINDPTVGYGIFIENMLEAAG